MDTQAPETTPLFNEIKMLVDTAHNRAAVAVNSSLTMLYWQVGKRISCETLKGQRATYGAEIVQTLANQLTAQYGREWSKRNLLNMTKFYQQFQDDKIVQTLSAQLSRSMTSSHPLASFFVLAKSRSKLSCSNLTRRQSMWPTI